MSETFFLALPGSSLSCAVFETKSDHGEKSNLIVSATLGLSTMKYKQEMTYDDARMFFSNLMSQGWKQVEKQEAAKCGFSHEFVWNVYQ